MPSRARGKNIFVARRSSSARRAIGFGVAVNRISVRHSSLNNQLKASGPAKKLMVVAVENLSIFIQYHGVIQIPNLARKI